MIKRLVPAALALAVVGITSCNNDSFKKTKEGLEYRIVTDKKEGKNLSAGDMATVKLRIYYTEKDKKDSLLQDYVAMNGGQPIEIPVDVPLQFKSDWPAGLKLLSKGDSALFRIPTDTIMKLSAAQGGQLPPFIKKGAYVMYSVVVVSVKTEAEVKQAQEKAQQEMMQQSASQMAIDDKLMQDYFAANNLKPTKTGTGLYYLIEKEGTGSTAQKGQTVTVDYTGKLLNGNVFDSNVDPKFQHVEPLSVRVGDGQVIPGWEEGLMLLKKGSRAKLFIPSPLAYGSQARGEEMPANSVLVFDIDVKDIK
ncbi:hypothetical protein CAP35_09655 [Chitinophagaceae bacterium IBVUCB1]|nr:hypothetical protein CAP35_09655 [Chitinophagaceae bacterium IBVUCB1]